MAGSYLCAAIVFIAASVALKYLLDKRKTFLLALQLPGPPALPIIGNAYIFLCHPDHFLKKLLDVLKAYPQSMVRFWFGPQLSLLVSDPELVKKILTSNRTTSKHRIYNTLKPFVGDGMISGSGPKWKAARKLIQPLYGIKFVSDSIGISNKHINKCMGIMHEYLERNEFCIEPIIHNCVIDIIGESILGFSLDLQNGKNKDFKLIMKEVYNVIYPRLLKPWLQIDCIYNQTELKIKQDKCVDTLQRIFKSVDANLQKYRKNNRTLIIDGFRPSINDIAEKFEESKELSQKDYIDNLITLFAASEDTVTLIISSACLCFGMYPECQEKVAEEIKNKVGIYTTNITYEDLCKLEYLDMCVKETLRLFPIAPFIVREISEEFPLDKYNIPPGCGLVINIFQLHLNEKEWQKPMDFHPEHFSQESISKRHPFSYIPFSAGPRGCIGKHFAYAQIKILLINILQRYRIVAGGGFTCYQDVFDQLKSDISVRSKKGYPIILKRRSWN